MAYLTDFIAISVYVALGLIIMGFGCFLVDLVVPCSFRDDKEAESGSGLDYGRFIHIGRHNRQECHYFL